MDDAEGGSLDLAEVEAELCRLPDVAAVRIVADSVGRPVEVHVLAHTGKQPKQVVRDVQSVALASFGIELDRRIVSVVQLGPNGASTAEAPSENHMTRARITATQSQSSGLRTTVQVSLAHHDDEAVGYAEGSVAGSALSASGRAGDARRAPSARTRRRRSRRRQRAGRARGKPRRRCRVTRLRRPSARAPPDRLGDAAPQCRRRNRPRGARRDEPAFGASRDTARRRVTTPSGRRPDPTRR